jgi:pyruvate dehydrogenase E2 component (dihydrolipoamide acetyltransferase)
MAERTTQSWTTVPHFFVSREIDVSALKTARDAMVPKIEELHGVKMTHTDLIVAAVARALRKHPRMNASWENGRIVLHQDVNVGLAIAVENAVVAAVVHNADKTSIGDIAKQRIDKAQKARANRLAPSDIAGATFTISNLGMFNVDTFTAIIVPPQVGILAVGAIVDRVVVVDGMLAVKPMMTVTLSSDHRVIDGANAARFLNDVVLEIGQAGKFS